MPHPCPAAAAADATRPLPPAEVPHGGVGPVGPWEYAWHAAYLATLASGCEPAVAARLATRSVDGELAA